MTCERSRVPDYSRLLENTKEQTMDTRSLTPNEYQAAAARTICPQDVAFARLRDGIETKAYTVDDGVETPTVRLKTEQLMQALHSVIGRMGELGELAACLEKAIWYGQAFDVVNFCEESGDEEWYIAEGLTALQKSLADVLDRNIAKLKARFPDKYSDTLAAEENRNRDREREILEGKIEQDGNGFGQPHKEAEEPIWLKHRRPLNPPSYNSYCLACKIVPVYYKSSSQICGQCAADIKAGKRQDPEATIGSDVEDTSQY